MSETTTTLPPLDPTYEVDQATIDAFQATGHCVVRGLCTPAEIAVFKDVIESAAMTYNRQTRPLEERDTYGKAFLQITNLWRVDEGVAHFALAPRFARVAADLLQVDGVRMYHDQALFKEPHGGHTPWHQDQNYWPIAEPTVTMWMPLVDVPAEVGSMTFADGSHLHQDLGDQIIGDASEAHYQAIVERENWPTVTHGAMTAGDATFHAGWTLHRAPANPTDSMRSVMTVIYLPDGARVMEPRSVYQETDLKHWIPDTKPGELIASRKNPLLWSRS